MMKKSVDKHKQGGITILEFTLICLTLLTLMFGAFEFSRYVFSMQMLNELSRKAARLAVVCSVNDSADIVDLPGVVENRPLGFLAENLSISYLNGSGSETTAFEEIRFVKAEIVGYQFRFIPLLSFIGDGGAINTPNFPTILPAESLGIIRPNVNNENGTVEDC